MAKKLLMIDDQAGITRIVGLVARELGIEFKAINSSLAATEVFLEYRPNIVIIDMIMPEKDGLDVLNEILTTGIPTQIVLTSDFGDGFLKLGTGLAAFHGTQVSTLEKPFRRTALSNSRTLLFPSIVPIPTFADDLRAYGGDPDAVAEVCIDMRPSSRALPTACPMRPSPSTSSMPSRSSTMPSIRYDEPSGRTTNCWRYLWLRNQDRLSERQKVSSESLPMRHLRTARLPDTVGLSGTL
jgi:CheY-like chemotaxis protein